MHPVLFKLGAFEMRAYGFTLAISFLLGIFWAVRRAKRRGIDPEKIMDLSVVIILASIIGARFMYVIFHLDEFAGHWTDTFNPFQSNGQIGIAGLTMLGGVVLALVTSILYLRAKRLPVLKIADTVIPMFFLGEAITRIGCYLNGCCYGIPCHCALGVVFPPDSPAGAMYQGITIHPTQIYSSLYALVIFGAMLWIDRKPKFDGYLLYLALIFYGVGRFIIDLFRYYENSMILLRLGGKGLSMNQGISVALILFGAGLYLWQQRKGRAQNNA
ncbi:MAG TPA: prolipoprotein diacylglyceryl transferase [bacterium]|nr:prolipoprotein diacylglyceryl transferase [bacterium]HQI47258.1 prolipoprotein diacylglyceryl transferase [bacterium]HQJ64233.1 prolipoprotein diacylglyceryl transferase [bacterium]